MQRVTPEELKKANENLKAGEGDPIFSFSSDCIKIKSNLLTKQTATMIKIFLVHIPPFLFLSILIPIIKLAPNSVSKNSRSVCFTSLVLKQFYWLIINLFGDIIRFHGLQFAYQPEVSTPIFTWPVLETVSYFLDNGSEVFAYSMNKSIAFDLCKFIVLFCKMSRNLSLVFLRLIIYMYIHQFTNVHWGSEISSSFNITNGVDQGKMFAGFAYC